MIAADNFTSDLVGVDATRPAPNKALMMRTKRHFGINLRPNERISVGVGPGDRPMKGMGEGFIEPTLRISKTTQLTREGFDLELAKAPGETPDHVVVWLVDQQILFSGDPKLFNQYSLIPVNPAKGSGINHTQALALEGWFLGKTAQQMINTYKIMDQPLFVYNDNSSTQ